MRFVGTWGEFMEWLSPMNIDIGLIPVAIARSKLVKPAPHIQIEWEDAIYNDLRNHSMRFSWNQFLSGLLP